MISSHRYDADNSGTLEFDEFVSGCYDMMARRGTDDDGSESKSNVYSQGGETVQEDEEDYESGEMRW